MEYPSDVPEMMHHKHIYEYAKAYVHKHSLLDNILFENEVVLVEGSPFFWDSTHFVLAHLFLISTFIAINY